MACELRLYGRRMRRPPRHGAAVASRRRVRNLRVGAKLVFASRDGPGDIGLEERVVVITQCCELSRIDPSASRGGRRMRRPYKTRRRFGENIDRG